MTVANEYLTGGHQPPDGFTSTGPVREGQYKRYPDAPRTILGNDGLGELLREVNGLTRIRWMTGLSPEGRTRSHGTLTPARRVPSSGARYPVEVYVVQKEGVYHYDPAHHAVELLRAGDHRASLLPDQSADLMLVLTTVFWRNMAKYGSFGYRLMNLDAGAVLGQALAVAEATNLDPAVHLLFDDERIDRLLGLTPFAEAAVAVVALKQTDPVPAEATPARAIDPGSDVARLHAASRMSLLEHADRRRTVYGYRPATVPLDHLRRLLSGITANVVIAASTVEGLPAGSYDAGLNPLWTGDLRIPLANAAKSMMLADEFRYASFTVAINATYDLDVHGDRGYRMGNIAAGVLIQRVCLAASALGLDTHVHCDFDPAATAAALGTEPPVVLITAGMAGPNRADPQGEL